MIRVIEYVSENGNSPFAAWFETLEAKAASKVTTRLERMVAGNLSNVDGVGQGVFESKINFGPGYRIYFGKDGEGIVILLGGGTKKGQQTNINKAIALWKEYKSRKRKEAKKCR